MVDVRRKKKLWLMKRRHRLCSGLRQLYRASIKVDCAVPDINMTKHTIHYLRAALSFEELVQTLGYHTMSLYLSEYLPNTKVANEVTRVSFAETEFDSTSQ